jgi:hypothetical protein
MKYEKNLGRVPFFLCQGARRHTTSSKDSMMQNGCCIARLDLQPSSLKEKK